MKTDFDRYLSEISVRHHQVSEDEFGRTPDEIIREVTEKFAREMRAIMGSAATAQLPSPHPGQAKFNRERQAARVGE